MIHQCLLLMLLLLLTRLFWLDSLCCFCCFELTNKQSSLLFAKWFRAHANLRKFVYSFAFLFLSPSVFIYKIERESQKTWQQSILDKRNVCISQTCEQIKASFCCCCCCCRVCLLLTLQFQSLPLFIPNFVVVFVEFGAKSSATFIWGSLTLTKRAKTTAFVLLVTLNGSYISASIALMTTTKTTIAIKTTTTIAKFN